MNVITEWLAAREKRAKDQAELKRKQWFSGMFEKEDVRVDSENYLIKVRNVVFLVTLQSEGYAYRVKIKTIHEIPFESYGYISKRFQGAKNFLINTTNLGLYRYNCLADYAEYVEQFKYFFATDQELVNVIEQKFEKFMSMYLSKFEKIGKYDISYLGSIFEMKYDLDEISKEPYVFLVPTKIRIIDQFYEVKEIEDDTIDLYLFNPTRENMSILLGRLANYHHLKGLKIDDPPQYSEIDKI